MSYRPTELIKSLGDNSQWNTPPETQVVLGRHDCRSLYEYIGRLEKAVELLYKANAMFEDQMDERLDKIVLDANESIMDDLCGLSIPSEVYRPRQEAEQ